MIENLTIFKAWNEIKGIDNKIDLIKTLRETNADISSSKLKEILVQGGFKGNDAMLNALSKKDGYSKTLQNLYKSKNAYEKFILDELDRLKLLEPHIAIGYLRDYKREKWNKIERAMNLDKRQCQRYYAEYKGRTPQNNSTF